MCNLYNQFLRAIQDTNSTANNSYLACLISSVEAISDADGKDKTLSNYVKKLLNISMVENFTLKPCEAREFAQLLGEAHFYLLCKNKGIALSQIPKSNAETPDFRLTEYDMYFEVKTFSPVSGENGISKALENSLDANIKIEKQIEKGKKIAIGESITQPYGNRPYQKNNGVVTAIIETLIEKFKQNYKPGQFPNDKSFLVLNLSIIPPSRIDNCILRPAYPDNLLFEKAVSGELWMTTFGKPDMLILGNPESEGKPCIESTMVKLGILNNTDFKNISGILFMIHPWKQDAEIWGLYNHEKYDLWNCRAPEIIKTLIAIAGTNWNDDTDSNGWQLQRKKTDH